MKHKPRVKCTFCDQESTFNTYGTNAHVEWPACPKHSPLEYKYTVSTSEGKKFSPGGVLYARKTGIDEATIMLYSQQSSTKQNEESPRGRIGGTTKSESKHLALGESHLTTGNS